MLIDDGGRIIAEHGRVEAAKLLGLATVPTIRLSHLSETEKRAYILADNRLADKAGWDREILAIKLQGLIELDFDVEITGFSTADIDITLDDAAKATGKPPGPEDHVPDVPTTAVSRPEDLWALGPHRLLCGTALDAGSRHQILIGRPLGTVVLMPRW